MTQGQGQLDDDVRIEHVPADQLRERMLQLQQAGFSMLTDIGAVDYPERSLRFDVVYMLMKLPTAAAPLERVGRPERVRIIAQAGGEQAELPTMCDLWPNADWAEREIFDLFGVHFRNHPDLRRIQMPEDWEGHPLRKDYALRGNAGEPVPRPNQALKSNVNSGTPVSGRVAAAIAARKAAQTDSEGII